jgi:DNA-binding transcriptional ArsR family regulator
MMTTERAPMKLKDLEDVLGRLLNSRDRDRVLNELSKRLQVKRYVEYVAVGDGQPAATMQPKVRLVYTVLRDRGAMTLPELQEAMGEDFPRNTIRYAIAILRQAGLVESRREGEK